jgi:hypothetical protein
MYTFLIVFILGVTLVFTHKPEEPDVWFSANTIAVLDQSQYQYMVGRAKENDNESLRQLISSGTAVIVNYNTPALLLSEGRISKVKLLAGPHKGKVVYISHRGLYR